MQNITDYGFKRLFGEEPNKDLLLDFLNELLKNEQGTIKDLTYLKTEKLGDVEESRKAVLFEKLFEVAEIAKFTHDELMEYEESLKSYRDLQNSIDTAVEDKAIEIAKSLKQQGVDVKIIIQSTGLSKEEIENLKYGKQPALHCDALSKSKRVCRNMTV